MKLFNEKNKFFPILIITILVFASCLPIISGDFNKKIINQANSEKYEFVPNEFIVKFNNELDIDICKSSKDFYNTGISSVDKLNEKYSINHIEEIFESKIDQNLKNIFKFKVSKSSDILSIVQDYKFDPNVIYAEPNYIFQTCLTPNDPDFYLQYALHNTGQTNGTADADIDAPEAWDIETGDEDIVICIHDTGVDWDHPDLADNIWINSGEDLNGNGIVDPTDFNDIDDDSNGFIDDIRGYDFVDTTDPVAPGEDGTDPDNNPMDFHGHGTHCSGIASASTDNNIGIAGVSWNCSIMAVRIGYKAPSGNGYMEQDDSANGMVYAADNGAHVISMSWGGFGMSQLIQDAVNYSYSKGVILVAAAGNYNTDFRLYPGGYDEVIAVGATNHDDNRAGFSNYGSWVDVSAPGVDIYSTLFNDTYCSWSGTSMSTPTVAGLIGLILSKNPGYNQEEVRTIIRSTTDPINRTSRYIGTGRINAYEAIQRESTPIVNLDSELDDAFVYDEIQIIGTASGSTFVDYTISYGEGIYPGDRTVIVTSSTPVTDDVLASWSPPTDFDQELCTLFLDVYDSDEKLSKDCVVIKVNRAPFAPIIDGPEKIEVNVEYEFVFKTTDLNEDDVSYFVDWGDNTTDDWTPYYEGGNLVGIEHTYTEEGRYTIRAKAKDIYDAEGEWGEFDTSTPRSRESFDFKILNFFERFPIIYLILQNLLGN
jgi:subtilisin family serine protease